MSHHPERTARNVRPVNQPPSYFNPAVDDVNLEDAERARLSRLRYKQMLESERKSHVR